LPYYGANDFTKEFAVRRILSAFAVLLVLVVSGPNASAAPEEKWYQVDVLVFAQTAPGDDGEQWRTPTTLPEAKDAREPADATDSKLASAMAELQKDTSYSILAHKSWTQRADEKKLTQAVHIHSADDTLNGYVQFFVSRFLHLDLNLQLRDPTNPDLVYAIKDGRRIKTQETTYFDHPRFGALVLVTPTKPPADVTTDLKR